jgi:pyruvate/2-oxoglutarate dehydrogenase complex dihydrolipoamide dehydrogenase (E3) component
MRPCGRATRPSTPPATLRSTHAAGASARLCVANALDGAGRLARDLVIPHCTYTDPEVATVGLTPVRATEEGIALDTHRLELSKIETGVH